MTSSPLPAGRRRPSLAFLSGLGLVAVVRLLTRPFSLWEYDEFLFVAGVERFAPAQHRPHPPGYPLLVGLGKLFRWVFGDPFHALVALAVVSSLVGFAALFAAFRSLAGRLFPEAGPRRNETVALAAALLFHLSPAMLVHGPMPMSDPPMLMFLSLALWAATRLPAEPDRGAPMALLLGVFGSAAIGCRPQIAIAVLPMLAVAALLAAGWRKRLWALLGFALTSLAWFLPLVSACGGLGGFLALLGQQGALVARFDADEARRPWSAAGLAFRFVAHPWGDRWTSLPVLALASAGALSLLLGFRKRPRLLAPLAPLATLGAVHLAFCLATMEPRDGVRYALPSLPAVAFLAVLGLAALGALAGRLRPARPLPAWSLLLPVALLAAGFFRYAGPLLFVRSTTTSPTLQAVRWAEQTLPPNAVFLAEPELEGPARNLFRRRRRFRVNEGLMATFADSRPLYLLGDGESSWIGAKTFRWAESDAYGKLTRGFYRVVSVSPIPPDWRYLPLRGVHNFEPNLREKGLRWLAPEAAIRVDARGWKSVAFTLAVPPDAPWPSNRVAVRAGGRAPDEVEIPRGGKVRVEIPLPARPTLDVSFRSQSFFKTDEGRACAVQLLDVELGR